MKLQRFEWRPVAAAAVLACSASSAFAELPQDRFWAGLEYFYPTVSTTARFDATATARPGTTISLEDELDLSDRKGTPYLDLGMRLGENWRIEFEYYKLDRTASQDDHAPDRLGRHHVPDRCDGQHHLRFHDLPADRRLVVRQDAAGRGGRRLRAARHRLQDATLGSG